MHVIVCMRQRELPEPSMHAQSTFSGEIMWNEISTSRDWVCVASI